MWKLDFKNTLEFNFILLFFSQRNSHNQQQICLIYFHSLLPETFSERSTLQKDLIYCKLWWSVSSCSRKHKHFWLCGGKNWLKKGKWWAFQLENGIMLEYVTHYGALMLKLQTSCLKSECKNSQWRCDQMWPDVNSHSQRVRTFTCLFTRWFLAFVPWCSFLVNTALSLVLCCSAIYILFSLKLPLSHHGSLKFHLI